MAAIAAAVGLPGICSAASASPSSRELAIIEELKAQEDPTILKRRVWSDTEWNRYKNGKEDLDETLGILWAWRVSDNQDWGVRLKVPLRTHYSGGGTDSDRQGLGDIKLATGTALRLGRKWRAAAGAELRCPSATNELGNNAWRLQLFGTVAWDAAAWLTLSPSVEYNKSVDEVHGSKPQKFLEMFLPVTFILPERWSVTARYEAKVDYEKDDFWTHSAKFSIAKQLDQLPLGFSLSLKKQFVGAEKDFQVNFVTTYYFRSQKR